ncbi:MAG: QueT transporter family protein [Lachnospiraceae bacterium]|nr:QueT transporter family protein [Lachnospiraceae bacterium]
MNNRSKIVYLVQAAMIAAIYVVLTYLFAPFSFGEVQVRISEALTILPAFTPAAIPGLFVGCLIGNILGGAILPDIIFGSIATLFGACGTYLLCHANAEGRRKYLAPVPPIVANTLIVPFVLRFGYGVPLPIPFMMLTVGVGEVISCGVLGMIVYQAVARYKNILFRPVNA